MTKGEPRSFGDFAPSDHAFNVTAYELKPVHRWIPDPFGPSAEPEFAMHVDGTAVANEANVYIIGEDHRSETFPLNIHSNLTFAKKWALFRQLYEEMYLSQFNNTPECALLRLQCDSFDKIAPTAFLSFIDYNWNLECGVPESVLEALRTSVETGGVDAVTISIKWVGGIIDEETTSRWHIDNQLGGLEERVDIETWGLFTLPGVSSPEPSQASVRLYQALAHPSLPRHQFPDRPWIPRPEPLWGYISALEWTPAREGVVSKRPPSERLVQERDRYIERHAKGELEDTFFVRGMFIKRLNDRASPILDLLTQGLPRYCTDNNIPSADLPTLFVDIL